MFLSVQYYELPHPGYLDLTLRELKIGTYENIATVSMIQYLGRVFLLVYLHEMYLQPAKVCFVDRLF